MYNVTTVFCNTVLKFATTTGAVASYFICEDKNEFNLGEKVKNTAIGTAIVVGCAALAQGAIYLIKKCTKSDPEPELSAAEAKSFAELKKDPQVKSVEAVVDGKEKTL